MKYQVGFTVELQGEMSVEADDIEEAKEIVSDELRFLTIDDASADTTYLLIEEPYEWDEAAQERDRQEIEEIFKKYPNGKQGNTEL